MTVDTTVKLSDITQNSTLEHQGVKGMKWGVRKDRTGRIAPRATTAKADRKDAEWLDNKQSRGESFDKAYDATYRKAAGPIRRAIRRINRDERFAGQDFRTDSPLRKTYYKEVSDATSRELNFAATTKGKSPSGRLEMVFDINVEKEALPTVTVRRRDGAKGRRDRRNKTKAERKEIKHADSPADDTFPLKLNDKGYIVDIDFEHPVKMGGELAHHGIRGMKWGVRKDRSVGVTITKKSAPKNPKENQSADSKKSDKLHLKKIHELSNAELTALNKRSELEKKYKELNPSTFEKGMKKVKEIVDTATTIQKAYKLVKDPLGSGNKGGGGGGKSKSGISDTLAKAKAEAMKRSKPKNPEDMTLNEYSKKIGNMTLSEIRKSSVTTIPPEFFKKK